MTTREVSYNLAGVVRSMSLPVAGTTIRLYDYWSTGRGLHKHYLTEQVTNNKGEFAFDVRKGMYAIEVVPNRDTRFARQSFETVKVTTNKAFTINLKTGCIFQGSVRTTDGGLLKNCELLFSCIEPYLLRTSEITDQNGKFSIGLPDGRYYVACRQNQLDEEDELEVASFLAPNLQVVDIGRDLRQDIVLPSLVLFSGSINNVEGHPVAGVRVVIRSSQKGENTFEQEVDVSATCFSDDFGKFACLVEPGNYDVKMEPPHHSHVSERQFNSIHIDQNRERTFALGPGYRLFGTVTFQGQPVENALVSISGGKIDSSVLTDSKGKYSVSLSGGTYNLSVAAQPDSLAKLPFRTLSPLSTTISLAEDTMKNFELEQGVLLNGTIVDHLGQPRSGVQLALMPSEAQQSNGHTQQPIAFGITGDDGSYEFRVKPGTYQLLMNNQKTSAQIVTATDEEPKQELTWNDACIVCFELVSELDEPISNCRIVCDTYQSTTNAHEGWQGIEPYSANSNEEGRGQLILPAGIYSIRIEPPRHGSYEGKQIRQLSINSDMAKKIKLEYKS